MFTTLAEGRLPSQTPFHMAALLLAAINNKKVTDKTLSHHGNARNTKQRWFQLKTTEVFVQIY